MSDRPNILVVFTDDERFDERAFMPNARRLQHEGTLFRMMRQPVPMCSPARATFLRGQSPTGPNGHGLVSQTGQWHQGLREQSLSRWLHDAGYFVGHIGKFFTVYDRPEHSDGWSWLRACTGGRHNSGYGYGIFDGTDVVWPEEHQDRYFARSVIEFMQTAPEPWFLWMCTTSPHTPLEPSPRNAGRWPGVVWPYEDHDVSTKPSWVRDSPPPGDRQVVAMRRNQRMRLRELCDVDDLLGMIVSYLHATGGDERTVLMHWSDNGNTMFEHRSVFNGKNTPYDITARTPLTVVGPGFPAGLVLDTVTTNPDVTATVLDLAGAAASIPQDGISLRRVLHEPERFAGRAMLGFNCSEYSAVRGPGCDWVATATRKLIRNHEPEGGFVEETDRYELYDLATDPGELRNLAHAPTWRAERDGLEELLDDLLAGRTDGIDGLDARGSSAPAVPSGDAVPSQ